ncbi:MAG: OB-fold nucleic acid binding domain-containing protein [Candidatus Diapherotrites archaeon]|nr:OB-fold nucleic acid binding domain-containing protein [Candidatus Diapherotrites archaeon]
MLDETAIIKISIAAAAAGIALLFAAQYFFEAKEIWVSDVNVQIAGETVLLHGKVDSAFRKGNALFFQLNDGSGKIKGVVFNPDEKESGLLQKNSFVAVRGKIQLYEGAPEIVAENLEKWQ